LVFVLICLVTFTAREAARHRLVQEIIAAYERDDRAPALAGKKQNPERGN
jgi:phosphate starvation-inducible protein PhoH